MNPPSRGPDSESGRVGAAFIVVSNWLARFAHARRRHLPKNQEISDCMAKVHHGLADGHPLAIVPALIERVAEGLGGSRAV